ncbi:MAG TPA: O-antigen ligase family protein, partial [Anaerolineales bacterium]|nr:O-antigen ligase family protein [Anaerolineales bacterium]
DAYTHMLFANHYAENWFSLWEVRWYTGFTVVSYPPLTHQLIALFVPILGFDKAFAFILWIVTTLYPLGIYAFSRVFTGKAAASYAALASAILLPVYVTAHIFGQLPFLASTLFALFGAASLNRYLREGGFHNFALTVSLVTTCMATHHATLIVQPFLIVAVITQRYFHTESIFLLPELKRSSLLLRFVLFAIPAILTSLIVIWPFWEWGMGQTIQTPIDHPSRHNFFKDPLAHLIFFWPLYGPLVLIIPFLFGRWPLRFIGLISSFIVLFLLGLGGTTSLPLLLFGEAWEWLIYDRFAFWASLVLTPFFGILFIQLKRRWRNHFNSKPILGMVRTNIFSAITFSVFALTALGAWLTPLLFPTQPEPVNMLPIVNFLNQEDRSQWRYLTFGFGDQFAHLNLLTRATTIDGSYHTARTLPELRQSGIGQVDTAYWALKGIPAIGPILQRSGEHGVRWGFVNRKDFIPELKKNGWIYLQRLSNGVQVWENPQVVLPKPSSPPFAPPIASFSWGVFPILAFVTTSALGALRIWRVQSEKVLRGIHAFIVGLIPVSLCFWYYRTMAEIAYDRVNFLYSSALFFPSDALALLAVTLWVCTLIAKPITLRITNYGETSLGDKLSIPPFAFHLVVFAICLLATISILWSTDWRTSLYFSLHLWLVFLLILSISNWQEARKPVMLGFCAALSIQIITGMVGFATQSTAFLSPFHLNWPGILDPSMRGVSAVHLSDSLRVLRSYGTLPHPNILGGFILVSLLGPTSLFLTNKKLNHPALILFALGISLLALTFSRSAWLGLIVLSLILIWKSKNLDRKRLGLLLITAILSFAITLLPYYHLVQARTVNIIAASEKFSFTARIWLNQQALYMIRENLFTGVGVGSFTIKLSQRVGEGYIIEPVHNLPLLAGTELGLGGLILTNILPIMFAHHLFKTQNQNSILAGATITGLIVIGLFDHYLWSLAPGRLMLALALGLWASQISDSDI